MSQFTRPLKSTFGSKKVKRNDHQFQHNVRPPTLPGRGSSSVESGSVGSGLYVVGHSENGEGSSLMIKKLCDYCRLELPSILTGNSRMEYILTSVVYSNGTSYERVTHFCNADCLREYLNQEASKAKSK